MIEVCQDSKVHFHILSRTELSYHASAEPNCRLLATSRCCSGNGRPTVCTQWYSVENNAKYSCARKS
ncbi:hypothetical protein BGY98DRAFT_965267 [Russula aff. rugulosa BPL654]|nr:hypothetical protein BGY98DRAFT_965267 [Russula aff. rugulosa BPL654]